MLEEEIIAGIGSVIICLPLIIALISMSFVIIFWAISICIRLIKGAFYD